MSTVVLDTITGKSTATTITIGSTPVVSASANSMTIRGEGSNQTSIQQGLAKVWHNFNGTGTVATNDSLNVASLTDNKEGDYTTAYTNNMGNANYLHLHHVIEASVYTQYIANDYSKTTSQLRMEQDSWNGSASAHGVNDDFTHCNEAMFGDLA